MRALALSNPGSRHEHRPVDVAAHACGAGGRARYKRFVALRGRFVTRSAPFVASALRLVLRLPTMDSSAAAEPVSRETQGPGDTGAPRREATKRYPTKE